jgi:alpha-tubulin suppressor-like RCC1 family protein
LPAPAIVSENRTKGHRLLFAGSLLVASCLALLAFSASAQAAGSTAMGWGDNYHGETGNGTPTKVGCQCLPAPTVVSGLSDATQISSGWSHTVALHADGTVTAWGINDLGQLGDGTTTESTKPVPVSGLSNVVAIDAGYEHSLALLADGTVMAWGDNGYGELGVGGSNFGGGGPETCGATHPCSKVPVRVPGLSNVVAISAGYFHSSFALLADGTVMGWGYDGHGQLGDGAGVQAGCECQERPVQIPGVSGVMGIASGRDHVLALLGNGTLTAWGRNDEGQLGTGTIVESAPPACFCVRAVGVQGLPGTAGQVAAGGFHSLALLGGGNPWSWGYNLEGELGNGTTTPTGCQCIPTPGAVSGLSGVQSIAAGKYHTLALLGDGSVRSWGYNAGGQLGDGTESDRSAPVPVSGVRGATDVMAGQNTSFVLLGPSHSLTVSLEGAGTGNVGGADGLLCPALSCNARFPDSQVQILRAEPAPGSGFAGFTGACTGTGPCQVRMDADKSVTATFGPPKGTKITKAKIKQGKKPRKGAKRKAKASRTAKPRRKPKPTASATFSFSAPGAVSGYQCMLVKPKPKPKKKGKRAKRAKPRFSSCASPKRYKKLRKGRYTFKVRALNSLGVDAQPAVRKFRIRR